MSFLPRLSFLLNLCNARGGIVGRAAVFALRGSHFLPISLQIKHIQLDSVGFVLLDNAVLQGAVGGAGDVLTASSSFFTDGVREARIFLRF